MMELTRFWIVCLCLVIINCVQAFSIYETPDRIEADGFPSETHHVSTHDGYILEMHRIPYGRSVEYVDIDRPVVFVMHGLLSASNSFVGLGPDYSLAYNLADAGFDVWLGNARGTKNSRFHVTLDPDNTVHKRQFFDFSWEEIGIYDMPAMIDYVLEYTGQESLHYIGHSQGGTVFLVLNSWRTEFNVKIRSAHLLAAVGYQEYFPDVELAALAERTDAIYAMAVETGNVELYPPGSSNSGGIYDLVDGSGDEDIFIGTEQFKTSDYCTGNLETKYFCEMFGVKHILRDDATAPNDVAGASVKQFAHYGQNIRDKLFRQFNYGTEGNKQVYGLENPPLFNLSLITTHVTHHYSANDYLLDERDVLNMAELMPNANVRRVARDSFEHSDFVNALDAKELVTDYIIEAIRNPPEVYFPTYTTNLEVIVVEGVSLDEQTTEYVTTEAPNEVITSPPDGSNSASYIYNFTISLYIILVRMVLITM